MARFFREPALRPDQLNEDNQVTDRKVLAPERFKFGLACLMYQSEENGMGPLHTIIVRLLGGTAVHLGFAGSMGAVGSLAQFLGAFLLRFFRSNKRAMTAALATGAVLGLSLAVTLFVAWRRPDLLSGCLIAYLAFLICMAAASGVQNNLETSWIGDLVPRAILGWFTSVKWVVAAAGSFGFVLVFGQIAAFSPYLSTFAIMFVFIGISHGVALLLMATIPDRVPRHAGFVAANAADRLNYRSSPLWCYIAFYVLWSAGRQAFRAFTTAYLLDYFGLSIGKLIWLEVINNVVNILLLLMMGKVTDKYGARLPLMLVSGLVSVCMLLWVFSAWWGLALIVVYQIVNGAAGTTHSMLAINYGLELFPAKGRSGYIGFSRIFIGASGLLATVGAGFLVRSMEGFSRTVNGALLNHYHVFFVICAATAFSSLLPLAIAGRRTVSEAA